ncbi:hypothetical protein ACF3NL_02950 [Dolosigranulum pigrum]|uniref:hypothetical protein n=1 Tax=Dolosigranulum pigrum TaxID=29394 RepID=UPI00370D37BB
MDKQVCNIKVERQLIGNVNREIEKAINTLELSSEGMSILGNSSGRCDQTIFIYSTKRYIDSFYTVLEDVREDLLNVIDCLSQIDPVSKETDQGEILGYQVDAWKQPQVLMELSRRLEQANHPIYSQLTIDQFISRAVLEKLKEIEESGQHE